MAAVEIHTIRRRQYRQCVSGAKALLKRRGIPYKEIDISGHWERRDKALRQAGGQITVPQFFYANIYIGGHRHLEASDNSGELGKMIASQV